MKKLSQKQTMNAMRQTALLRDKLLADEMRPRYHFAAYGDYGLPGDPNMAFYADGRYHLMFLYRNLSDYFRLGHISSTDLLHWRMHPDAVFPDKFDGGIFSGGAFIDDDGTAYMAYWGLPIEKGKKSQNPMGGIRLAKSTDRANHYEKWEKFDEYAVCATPEPGLTEVKDANGNTVDWLGCADPSNIWKVGDTYYMQLGALVVLNKFRNNPDAPARLLGDWTELYSSSDMHTWTHRGRFYSRNDSDIWTDKSEDDMCPSFLPLPLSPCGKGDSGKYLQLFIAHNKGAQYYIGSYEPEKADCPFTIETHGRMSYNDLSFFAPEALVDKEHRQIMWAWLHDDRFEGDEESIRNGYCGVYCLPRTLWYNERGGLGIAPVEELRRLRYNQTDDIHKVNARSCEVSLSARVGAKGRAGLRVYMSDKEYVDVFYDSASQKLIYDATHAVQGSQAKAREEAPLELDNGEELRLDIFVDRSVIEVFANDRQAICRRSYVNGAPRFSLERLYENAVITNITAWDIAETNLF